MGTRKKIVLVIGFILIAIIIGNMWALFADYKASKANEKFGIESQVKDFNEDSFTVVIKCEGLNTDEYLFVDTGPWHEIEKRTIFGWVKLRCLHDSWTMGAVNEYDITEKDKTYELEVFYPWYYGDLRSGTYRVKNAIKTEKSGKEEVAGYFHTTFKVD